jgi:glycosyltransferase involved in cell wall biosynthesis
MSEGNVVWLANNITHYHRARADAFARSWRGRFIVLELSKRNGFSVLQGKTCDIADVVTLFTDRGIQEIGKADLRKAIFDYLDDSNPDVCCLNGWGMPGAAVMLDWATRRSIPCIIMSESNKHDSTRAWWKEETKRRFVGLCSAALVGGTWSREYLIQLGMHPECVFDGYDVVDNQHFRAGAENARLDSIRTPKSLGVQCGYFLACSRFESKKNLRRLIEAYSIYVRQVSPNPWRLVIVGDGPSRPELESLAIYLGISSMVEFRGLVGYFELPKIYGLASAFVHASTTEQWGLVVNEAMAAGLPVLVSERCGCVSELVKNGVNGFTFNPFDSGGIAQKMLMIHRDLSLLERMGQESAAIIVDWGPERFARNLRRAVECALDRGPQRSGMISKAVVRLMAAR